MAEIIVEVLIDSFKDVIRVFPLLFLSLVLIDWVMKFINKDHGLMSKLSKLKIIGGGLLGIIPQCGIPVAFTKLYANGYITLGMLMAILIANSDEGLLILAANPEQWGLVIKIIVIKVLIAIPMGYLVNIIIKEKRNRLKGCSVDCYCPKCRKDKSLFTGSLVHALKITGFLWATVVLINFGIEKMGEEHFYALLDKNNWLQPVYSAFIGMIPSCFSSIFIAESYAKGVLSFGAMLSGLLANTGYGILVLLRELPFLKGMKVIGILLFSSILVGEILILG